MGSLVKVKTVLIRHDDPIARSVPFKSLLDDPMFHWIDERLWDEMGRPNTITMTVDQGNTVDP